MNENEATPYATVINADEQSAMSIFSDRAILCLEKSFKVNQYPPKRNMSELSQVISRTKYNGAFPTKFANDA